MQNVAFTMQIKPGSEAEYKRRHDEIDPELMKLLRDVGISDYSIFWDPTTNILFAVMKLREGHRVESLKENPIMRKWWNYMADLMDVHPDNEPICGELKPMFHMA